MKTIIKKSKASALLYHLRIRECFPLTNEDDCADMRKLLNVSKSELNTLIQTLSDLELVDVEHEWGNVMVSLTEKAVSTISNHKSFMIEFDGINT
jgi:hypothetical protein